MTHGIVVHQLAGRLRLKIPDMRGKPAYFSALTEKLRDIDAVQDLAANSMTGSIVIRFQGAADPLLNRIRERVPELRIESNTSKAATSSSIRPVRIITGRDINPMFLVGSAMVILGLVQVFRGQIAVPSVTAFWYARKAFRASGKSP